MESYQKLSDTIDAHYVLSEDDTYLQLIKELKVLIGEYNQRVENRTDDRCAGSTRYKRAYSYALSVNYYSR